MHVVFLHGPFAVGKHAVGTALSRLTGLPLFHNHLAVDTALSLFAFGSEGFRRMREVIWLSAFENAARAGQSFIFTFSPERSVDPALIDRLRETVAAHGGHTYYIELTCPRETILQRLPEASRHRFHKLVDTNLYLELERSGTFEFPPFPAPLLTVDTECDSPETVAQRIQADLERL
jgi:hypothetical protein